MAKMNRMSRIFLFKREDIVEPEDEQAYDVSLAIDSNSVATEEEYIDFINSCLHSIDEDVCFYVLDGRNRVIDCGAGEKFEEQREGKNSFCEYFC